MHRFALFLAGAFSFLVLAIFAKSECQVGANFFCWAVIEVEGIIHRYQTLITGMIALYVGYGSIKALREQMEVQKILSNQERAAAVEEIIVIIENNIDDYIEKYLSQLRVESTSSTIFNKIDMPSFISDASVYARLPAVDRDVIKRIICKIKEIDKYARKIRSPITLEIRQASRTIFGGYKEALNALISDFSVRKA